jgi:hypothetical protein
MIITQLNSGLQTGRQATGGLFRDRRQQSHRRVKACAMDRPPSGTCPRVKIPALRAGSFSLWSQRHVGVPGTRLGAWRGDCGSWAAGKGQILEGQVCKTKPIHGPGAHDCGLAIAGCGLKEQARMAFVPNEANLSRSRWLTEEIVQNEAKLGGTGVYGQRPLSCWAWLGRGVKRAKRSQFCPRAREWARVGGAARARRRAIVQNKANFRRGQTEVNCGPEKLL